MFSLQKMFSKDEKLFSLLELSAEEASQSIRSLNAVLLKPHDLPSLESFHGSKEADKQITRQIDEALISDFVTDIEREDVEMLSSVLYKIPKTVEKFAERLIVSRTRVIGMDFSAHVRVLDVATRQVVDMVKQLRNGCQVERIQEMNKVLQTVEGEADDLILKLLEKLYTGGYAATTVVAMKDLYELLEKIVDRCRDAGNVVSQIIIKQS